MTAPPVVLALTLGFSNVAQALVVHGAQLPAGAEKVGENRYRIPRDFESTLKYYQNVYSYAAFPRRSIVNQPAVKAVHISNPKGRGWLGMNIYSANGETRIYVIPAEAPKAKKKAAPPKRGRK